MKQNETLVELILSLTPTQMQSALCYASGFSPDAVEWAIKETLHPGYSISKEFLHPTVGTHYMEQLID